MSESQRGWGAPSVNPPPDSNSLRGAGTGCVSQLLPSSDKRKQGNTFQAGLSKGFSVCRPVQIKSIISWNKWLWECEKMTREQTVFFVCFLRNWQPLQAFSANVLRHHSPIPALNQHFLSSTGELILHMHECTCCHSMQCYIHNISSSTEKMKISLYDH